MPATAGRVRMPANNRVHSSAALQTHGIWQSAIGYDPYAPTTKDNGKKSSSEKASNSNEPEAENPYARFQGLMALAKITSSHLDEARGACKRCGRVGHLYIHCKNFVAVKNEGMKGGKDDGLLQEKLKGEKAKRRESSEEDDEEEEDGESWDSDYDSEIERIISERGKKASGKVKDDRSRRREDNKDKDEGDRREKRKNSDSEDEGRRRRRRKEKRRGRDDDSDQSSDEEEKRRRMRSHRRHKRRSRRTTSTSDSDDPLVGRDKKRSEKSSQAMTMRTSV